MKNSVISLISYDADLLPGSIRRYYNYVDEIVLGLDSDRITWNKNNFSFDEEKLFDELAKLDTDNKISVVEDNFHKFDEPIQNDNYERNVLKDHCSYDVILSFDADEYLLNAKDFFLEYLPIAAPYLKTHDICMNWAVPYKTIDNTTLVISEKDGTPFFREDQGISATKDSEYVYARWTDKSASGSNRLKSPLVAMHFSIDRTKKDLAFKLANTGHAKELQHNPMLSLWDNVTLKNYTQLQDFKTTKLGPLQWPSLTAVNTQDLEEYFLNHINEAYR